MSPNAPQAAAASHKQRSGTSDTTIKLTGTGLPCDEQRISPGPIRDRQVSKDNLRTIVTQHPKRFCAARGVDGIDVLFLESRRQLAQRLLSVVQHEEGLSWVHIILPALGLPRRGCVLNAKERSAQHEQARGL